MITAKTAKTAKTKSLVEIYADKLGKLKTLQAEVELYKRAIISETEDAFLKASRNEPTTSVPIEGGSVVYSRRPQIVPVVHKTAQKFYDRRWSFSVDSSKLAPGDRARIFKTLKKALPEGAANIRDGWVAKPDSLTSVLGTKGQKNKDFVRANAGITNSIRLA